MKPTATGSLLKKMLCWTRYTFTRGMKKKRKGSNVVLEGRGVGGWASLLILLIFRTAVAAHTFRRKKEKVVSLRCSWQAGDTEPDLLLDCCLTISRWILNMSLWKKVEIRTRYAATSPSPPWTLETGPAGFTSSHLTGWGVYIYIPKWLSKKIDGLGEKICEIT